MSVTLPIQALATMQVSLKIGSDGQFAVEMDPAGNANIPRAQLDGLKLHLQSVPDSAGIKLTLFVSVDVEAGSRHHPTVSVESCMEHHTRPALEFSAGAQLFDSFSELYSLESPYPNTLPDGPQAGEGSNSGSFESTQSFDAFQFYDILSQALDIDHPEPCHSNITSDGFDLALQPYDCDFQAGMLTELPAFEDHLPQVASKSTSPDAASPDTSISPSECDIDHSKPPSCTSSQNQSTRGSRRPLHLPCPEPSCSRTFKTKYALSSHAQKHSVKPPPCFPCSHCTLQFSRRHDRLRHEVSQHGRAREWECKLCSRCFSSQMTLRKHKCKARRTGR